jgi:nitroimidazol reductase NimA-like FMN-containing flavoprotein (pyridoxamine 5'-phosphate oxidase superfamily)
MKLDMMRKNPGVCFEVDNTKNLSNWQSVVAWGDFEELPTGVLRENGLKILQERKLPIISSETMQLGSHWPFTSAFKEDIGGVVFRIHLQEKTGRYEKTAIESSFVR